MNKYLVLLLSLISTNFAIQAQTLKDSLLEDIATYSRTSYRLLMNHDDLESSYNYSRNGSSISTTQNTDTYEFMNWDSYQSALNSMSTNIHEICHSYNHYIPYGKMQECECGMVNFIHKGFYLSPNEEYWIQMDKKLIFPSRKLIPEIPEHKRTFRFDTYIVGEQSAQGHGVLGLLDEFNAYYTGAKYMFDMYPIYVRQDPEWGYVFWANTTKGNMDAFFEFDFFIKEYLLYAKKHHSDTYVALQTNDSFKVIYQIIQSKYRDLLHEYNLKYQVLLEKNNESSSGFRWILNENPHDKRFDVLQKELSSDKYEEIQRDFGVF